MWIKGKKHSNESKVKMSLSKIGHICSEETKNKIGKANRGHTVTPELREKQRISHIGLNTWVKGLKRSIETRKKNSEAHKGSKSYNWKGGVKKENEIIRNSLEIRLWREIIFKRDNWTCVWCGKRGGNLEAHHIKSFSDFPELRFDEDNGITLCKGCHFKTDNYGNKKRIII